MKQGCSSIGWGIIVLVVVTVLALATGGALAPLDALK